MSVTSDFNIAVHCTEEVYARFLEVVVETKVAGHRVGGLAETTRSKVSTGKYTDTRFIRLMTMSGKGGYSCDPIEFTKRRSYTNVTLLDHLLSVGRGAMIFYLLDCLHKNPSMDKDLLKRHLALLLALGFMHDADKIAGISRKKELTPETVEQIASANGIIDFCKEFDLQLSAVQWLGMIQRVEGTQAHRHRDSQPPPRGMEILPLYVGYADKLDGTWLFDDPINGGIKGVIKRMEKDRAVEANPLNHWKALTLRDPHHPFLLDELQRWISLECRRVAGVPPLIEVHNDGELCMLLPNAHFDTIQQNGLDRLCRRLPFQLKLEVSNRGVPSLFNAQPTFSALSVYIAQTANEKKISSLFQIKYEMAQKIWDDLITLLEEVDVEPRLPNKSQGLVSLFAGFDHLTEMEKIWVRKTALLVLLTNLQVKAPAKAKIPTYDEREKRLLRTVNQDPPIWISAVSDAASRRVLTAIWISILSEENEDINEDIFGSEGLLKHWLEGTKKDKGFRDFIVGGGDQIIDCIRERLETLLGRKLVTGDQPGATGRCLFTGEPVAFDKSITQADGLYEVKVSAFSGRDNRPESVSIQKAHTNVSAASLAEHTIRSDIHKLQGGKKSGVPNLISSPTTMGLFGGLATTNDRAMPAMSIYDLSRQEIKKGRTLKGTEIYSKRWRIGRFERMPEKTAEQIDTLRLLLNAALRTGRPLHVFRGLPIKQRAFFHYDAMPRVCQALLGGKSLRIEQIPNAVERLEIARALGETHGLGYDALMLYAMPATRFQAICLACGVLEDKDKHGNVIQTLKSQYEEYVKGVNNMTEQDGALVQLGRVAAGIQRWPASGSGREERLVFNLCMDAAVQSRAAGQTDRQSVIYAVAGELQNNLVRKDKMAAGKHRDSVPLMEACISTAELFVDRIWFGALKGRVPSHKTRRLFAEIYRMSFLQTHRKNAGNQKENA
jgi:hypothetical protein